MDVGPFQFFEVNFEDFCGDLSGGGGILPESTKFFNPPPRIIMLMLFDRCNFV